MQHLRWSDVLSNRERQLNVLGWMICKKYQGANILTGILIWVNFCILFSLKQNVGRMIMWFCWGQPCSPKHLEIIIYRLWNLCSTSIPFHGLLWHIWTSTHKTEAPVIWMFHLAILLFFIFIILWLIVQFYNIIVLCPAKCICKS